MITPYIILTCKENNKKDVNRMSNKKIGGNIVQNYVASAGAWGGTCLCPDGNSYQVGDDGDSCGSLACVNGAMLNCNRMDGEWSKRKVICEVTRDGTLLVYWSKIN